MASDFCVAIFAVKKFLLGVLWNFCFSFVSMLEEKNDIKKIASDVPIVTRNSENEVPAKKKETWASEKSFL